LGNNSKQKGGKMKNKLLILTVMAAILVAGGTLFATMASAAHQVQYGISPDESFEYITGGHGVEDPELKESVVGDTNIQFSLVLSIKTNPGNQPYGQTITFGVTGTSGPDVPEVYFGGNQANTTFIFDAISSSSTLTEQVNIIAPAGNGPYTVTIGPTSQTGDNPQLNAVAITIGFTVSNPNGCTPSPTNLSLTLDPNCVVFKATSTTFTATLTSDGVALAGKPVNFKIGSTDLGSVKTDANGEAALTYDPSSLAVGTYSVVASFQGDDCYLEADPASANLGVKYDFLGFQPPVKIDGVGAGLFSGKVIPVKIKIADAMGMPVPDATAYITWTGTIANVAYTDAPAESVSAADSGNLMRYDLVADQYIYNWDVSKLDNGSFTINIDMGEGCGGDRIATVILQKNSGKKK
jgi:hypothetical protein